MISVSIKWGTQKFDDVELATNESLDTFKAQLYSLTGVEPKRQKILTKGVLLKDNSELSKLNIKPGQLFLLIGSVEEPTSSTLEKPAQETTTTPSQTNPAETKYKTIDTYVPCGLVNVGNSCYFNSSLQFINSIYELRSELLKLRSNAPTSTGSSLPANNLISVLGSTLHEMSDKSWTNPSPVLTLFRTLYPQFSQKSPDGMYCQQDAEECYICLLNALSTNSASGRGGPWEKLTHDLLNIEFQATITCPAQVSQNIAELTPPTPIVSMENALKLDCHITQGTTQLLTGLISGLKSEFTSYCPELGRDAVFCKSLKITHLPPYLVINFIRFFWKREEKTKVKILKKVGFPLVFDAYHLCDHEYAEELKARRSNHYQEALESKQLESGGVPIVPTYEAHHLPETTGFYDLISVITHGGRSADSGHYICWTRDEKYKTIWWKYDDDIVTQVTQENILRLDGGGDWHMAYLCIYKAKALEKKDAA